jgi:hypothetical protein
MYGRMSLAPLGYECMKNHYSTNSYRECCSEKMPLSRSRSGSLSSKLDALTQLSAPLLLRPLPPAVLGQSLLPGLLGLLARHRGRETVGPALLAAALLLLVL